MKVEVYPDADSVARQAAKFIAAEARAAVADRGSFVMSVRGGRLSLKTSHVLRRPPEVT